MAVTGTVNLITDLEAFFASYIESPEAPDPSTFKPLSNARVQLRSAAALVPLVVETDTDADGRFTLVPPNRPGLMTRLVVHRRVSILQAAVSGPIHPLPTVEQLAYRSARVRLDRLDDEPLAIYTAAPDITATISQAQVDAELEPLAAELETDELSAQIIDGGVQVHGRRGPATVDVRVRIQADASADLDQFVDGVIEDLQVHVPFPATLCVNEQKIADKVREGVRDVFDEVNRDDVKQPFIEAVADATGVPAAVIELAFDQLVSLSIRRLRFPGEDGQRRIEASPAVAVPRGALTPAPLLAGAVGRP